jgi:homoserine O-acetyltransferase
MSSNIATETEEDEDASASFGSDDEYNACAHAGANSRTFRLRAPLALERGGELHGVEVAYTTYGTLNEARDNVIVLCHALTGDSLVHQYWDSMVTSKWTDEYFIVCSNILGSCYGTTGPASINPATGKLYGASFPAITMRDAVQLQKKLLQEELGVEQVQCVIGGSLGGMTTLEWAFLGEDFVKSFVTIACGSHQSAWQIGMGELQRQAIYMDPLFKNGDYDPAHPPTQGLSLARQMAMMSYRSHGAYQEKFGRELIDHETVSKYDRFVVQSYLEYQGKKFLSRFDVNSYLALLHLMDTHDVGRNRGGVEHALSTLTQPALVVGVETDVLYPICEQRDIASALPRASFESISSIHGHDGFLLEQEAIGPLVSRFLQRTEQSQAHKDTFAGTVNFNPLCF